MNWNNEDYELAGQCLDGRPVELTGAQRALVDEIRSDWRAVAGRLDVPAPAGMLHRVNARVKASRPRRRPYLRLAGGAAAAAAAVLVVLLAWQKGPDNNNLGPSNMPNMTAAESPADYIVQYLMGEEGTFEARRDSLDEQIANTQMDLALGENLHYDLTLDGLVDDLSATEFEDLDPSIVD